MAAFNEYSPGPSVAEQHNSLANLLAAFYGAASPERIGSIGGSPSKTWYLTSVTVSGPVGNPWIALNWATTPAEHTATTTCRYNAALLGTMDPSIPALSTPYFKLWVAARLQAEFVTWQGRLGSSAALGNALQYLAFQWWDDLDGGGDRTGSLCAARNYTDGARAGQFLCARVLWAYNPTAGELAAGIHQLEATTIVGPSDADDGTVNIAGDGGSLGEATSQVPVPIATTTVAQQGWLDWANTQILNNRNVSHPDDLGGVTPKSAEPAPGDAIPIYGDPGSVPAVTDDPSIWDLLTTVPSFIASFFLSVGKLAASLAGAGIVSASIAGLGAIEAIKGYIEANIAVDLDRLADQAESTGLQVDLIQDSLANSEAHLGTAATELAEISAGVTALDTSIDGVSTSVGSVSTALTGTVAPAITGLEASIDALVVAGPNNDLVSAIQAVSGSADDVAVAAGANAAATGAVAGQLDPGTPGTLAKRLVDALESIADSLKADGTTSPPTPKLSQGIRQLQDRLGDVADLQQSLTLIAHGFKVHSTIGVEEP